MTIVVEDGSIVTNSNSYVSEAELTAYASARGITLVGDEEELLIKAMDYIESLSFIGIKFTRDQSLQWPRVDVVIDGYYVDADTIPQELKNGQMAVALAIDEGNSPLSNVERKTIRERVGEIEVEYSEGSSSTIISRSINAALSKLIAGGGVMFKVIKA